MPSPRLRPKAQRGPIDLSAEDELATRIADPDAFATIDVNAGRLERWALAFVQHAASRPDSAVHYLKIARSRRADRSAR